MQGRFQYTEGTIKNPQHTKSTEACFEKTNLVHFPEGKLTPIPAFVASSVNGLSVSGTVRSQWAAVLRTTNYVGGHYLFGSSYGLYEEYGGRRRNITPLKTTKEATLTSDPLAITDTETTLYITYTAHGLSVGDRIKLTGATDGAGITAADDINIEHIVATVEDANTITVELASAATSTDASFGGTPDIFYQIAAGNEYQEYLSGYGAGIFGAGNFNVSQTSASTFKFPRIWSFDNFGSGVVMCPGDYDAGDGQKIYDWAGNNTVAPAVMSGAPTDCQFVFVVNNRIIALCGTKIKIAGLDNVLAPIWSGYGYNEIPVQGTTLLLSGFKIGDKSAIIFAPTPYLLTFNGSVPDLLELDAEYAIAAPMAACRLEDGLIWYGVNGNFYFYNGSTVQTTVNAQNGEYIRDNINANAVWTTFMMADQKHNQAWMYFPTGDSQDPNEYVIINPRRYSSGKPSFTLGTQSRTSAQRPTLVLDRFYMYDADTQYTHFTNQSVSFSWSAKSAAFYAGNGGTARLVSVEPDNYQGGNAIDLTVYGLSGGQAAEVDYGTFEVFPSAVLVSTPAQGKLLAFEFSGMNDAMIPFMTINYNVRGGRVR